VRSADPALLVVALNRLPRTTLPKPSSSPPLDGRTWSLPIPSSIPTTRSVYIATTPFRSDKRVPPFALLCSQAYTRHLHSSCTAKTPKLFPIRFQIPSLYRNLWNSANTNSKSRPASSVIATTCPVQDSLHARLAVSWPEPWRVSRLPRTFAAQRVMHSHVRRVLLPLAHRRERRNHKIRERGLLGSMRFDLPTFR